MGFNFTWCAFREEKTDFLLKQLRLRRTGVADETPDAPLSLARLETGWTVIWCNEHGYLSTKAMPKLSREADIVLCEISEGAMCNSAELWSGGQRKWGVLYLGDRRPRGFEAKGDVPATLVSISREMEKKQREADERKAGVDYIFEIPLLVAKEMVGFKHDECRGVIFEVLTHDVPEAREGFFRRFFH